MNFFGGKTDVTLHNRFPAYFHAGFVWFVIYSVPWWRHRLRFDGMGDACVVSICCVKASANIEKNDLLTPYSTDVLAHLRVQNVKGARSPFPRWKERSKNYIALLPGHLEWEWKKRRSSAQREVISFVTSIARKSRSATQSWSIHEKQ